MDDAVNWGAGVPLMAGPFQIGLYEPSPETVGYWEGIKAGKLMIKRCLSCNRHQHPRRLFCSLCESDRFEWVEAGGSGTVYSFSTVHRAPRPEFEAEVPYTVGILELQEGIYLFSRILPPAGGEVKIGARAKLRFQKTGPSGRLPAFYIEDQEKR